MLECIDLGSDSEDEGFSSSLTGTVSGYAQNANRVCMREFYFGEVVLPSVLQLEDKITCHKARVTSTLDRLAQKVAQDKAERANKCKAFKVRWCLLSH